MLDGITVYIVGTTKVHCYCDTLEAAKKTRAEDGLDRRTGIYKWKQQPLGYKCGMLISAPVRVD